MSAQLNHGEENMATKNNRRRIVQSSVLAGATAALLAATALPAAATSAPSIEDVIPALAAPQTDADIAPSSVNLQALDVEASALRSLGSDEVADYWVARSGTEDVCLIAYVRGGNDVAGSACVSLANFYQTGLGIVTGESRDTPDRATEAYLIPADVDVALVPQSAQARQTSASNEFVAARPGAVDFTRTEITRADGSTFVFSPIR